MVPDDIGVFAIVDHVDVAIVGALDALMITAHLHSLVDAVTATVNAHALGRITDPEIFLILAAIELDK